MEWYYILLILGVLLAVALVFLFTQCTTKTQSSLRLTSTNNILKITNQFDFPIWVEGKYGNSGTPVPLGQNLYIDTDLLKRYTTNSDEENYWKSAATTVEIPPNYSIYYNIDQGGIAGARFWAKFSCSPCGESGTYASSPALCLPPYPVGCSSTGGCDFQGAGTECIFGDSSQYYVPPNVNTNGGSIGGCPPKGCSPPIDSLFEATFGCSLSDQSKCNKNPSSSSGELLGPSTFFDTSQVDGYTFPYVVLVTPSEVGGTGLNACINSNNGNKMPTTTIDGIESAYIDASGLYSGRSGLVLDYSEGQNGMIGCPNNTNLSYGTTTSVTDSSLPITYNITDVDLGLYMDKNTGNITFPFISGDTITGFTAGIAPPDNSVKIGCMSGCKRLNSGQPYGMNQSEGCVPGLYYCCPTTYSSPGCTGATGCCPGVSSGCINDTTNGENKTGCITSAQCNQGPVATSDYVQSIHNMAPGIYAFAYDDSQGLYSCGQSVNYEVIFGPTNSNPTNYWNSVWSNLQK